MKKNTGECVDKKCKKPISEHGKQIKSVYAKNTMNYKKRKGPD